MPKLKHFENLVKKTIIDKTGRKRTIWVRAGEKVKQAKQKVGEKVKQFKEKQAAEYDPKESGNWIQRKKKAIVKSIKNEVKEWKTAGQGVKKMFGKEKLTKEEKHAIKSVVIHTSIVLAIAAVGSTSAPAFAAKAAAGYLEHAGLMRAGHALIFSKAEEGEEMGDEEQHLHHLLDDMSKYFLSQKETKKE